MIKTFESELLSKENLSDDVFKFTFSCPDDFEFKAGQFVNVKVEKDDESKRRSYSILNPPSKKGVIELCIKIVLDGFASYVFNDAKVGDKFEFKGPFGHFVFDESADKDVEHWFIGAGTGITPFYSMINEFVASDFKMVLLGGARTVKNLLFHDEFEDLAKLRDNFDYFPTITRETWGGRIGRVQAHLPDDVSNKIFYICGLKELVLETEEILLKKGVSKENIKKERYS